MNKKTTVLYVDDENINIRLFEINFNRKYSVITAINPIKALEILLKNNNISVIISDMNMPIMNGVEFIKKASETHPHIRYYILSGYEKTKEMQEAINAGIIKQYFKKPFDRYEIEKAIDYLM